MVENGKKVTVHYTGRLVSGETFDSSEGRDPLQFEVGTGQIISGFERALIGKEIGEKVTVTINPEEGYGTVREDLFIKVNKQQMPENVQVGQSLQATSSTGQTVNVTVKEVNEDHVIVDGNHPLAGKELVFDIEVLSVD